MKNVHCVLINVSFNNYSLVFLCCGKILRIVPVAKYFKNVCISKITLSCNYVWSATKTLKKKIFKNNRIQVNLFGVVQLGKFYRGLFCS